MSKFTNKQIKEKDQVNRLIQDHKYKRCIWGLNLTKENVCSSKIVAAHSIQRGKILSNIAENGKVYRLFKDFSSNTLMASFQLEGIGKFITFKGFCKKHDKEIFQEIEDKPFKETPLQMDLYAYRAISKVLHSNLTSKNVYNKPIKNEYFLLNNDYKNICLNIKDLKNACFHIQDVIKNHNKPHYKHIYYALDKEYPIACSSSFPLYCDFNSN